MYMRGTSKKLVGKVYYGKTKRFSKCVHHKRIVQFRFLSPAFEVHLYRTGTAVSTPACQVVRTWLG